jgi:undecaprenyl pyrophosphate phosphatase UppP
MEATAGTPHYPVWAVIAVWAYFSFRLLRSARTQERRRREEGQPHTKRDTALLLLAALSVVGVLLGTMFLMPSNRLINSRAGFAAIIVVVGGGLTYFFNRRGAPHL